MLVGYNREDGPYTDPVLIYGEEDETVRAIMKAIVGYPPTILPTLVRTHMVELSYENFGKVVLFLEDFSGIGGYPIMSIEDNNNGTHTVNWCLYYANCPDTCPKWQPN